MEKDDLFVSPIRDPGHWSCGNGLLYSSFFYTILRLNHCLTEEDRVRFITMVDRCWVRDLMGQTVVGLLNRSLDRPDAQAQDDYHMVTASCLLQTDHAKAIYAYGNENKFCYDNQNPYKFSLNKWHGRFLGRPGYYAMAAGVDPGWLQDKLIACEINAGPSDDAGAVMQQFLRLQVYKIDMGLSLHIKEWNDEFSNKYKSLSAAIKGEMANNADHPFVKYNINVHGLIE